MRLSESVLSALRDQVVQAGRATEFASRAAGVLNWLDLKWTRTDREIVSQRFASAETLRNQGTISEFDYLERLREQKSIEGEVLDCGA